MSSKFNQYQATYAYQELIKAHSLNESGLWTIYGEDPNCDLGGHHSTPNLGVYEGVLGDIIKMAVELPAFWQWGYGGQIKKIKVNTVLPKAILTYKNNWETDIYSINGKRVITLQLVEINGMQYNVVSKIKNVDYYDHGHKRNAKSMHFFIDVAVAPDVKTTVDLNTIVNTVNVVAINYEVDNG